MRFLYASHGRPLVPLALSLGARRLSAEALLDIRLAFAWCRTDDVGMVLGQTNSFMEFDIGFFGSRRGFAVVPRGQELA